MVSSRINFPKQATVAYIDSFLRAVRNVIDVARSRVVLDLSATSELSSALICFLCGLVDISRSKQNLITIVLPRNKKSVKTIRMVQELTRCKDAPIRIAERLCQVRKITGNNNAAIEEILLLLEENLKMSSSARESIFVVLTELLTNAIDHSGEKSCYISAGAWGRSRYMHVTLLDFGIGIPQKLRTRYPQYEDDCEAVRALLKKGLTTRTGLEGGRGYQFIQEILKRNRGRLYIFTGKAKTVLKYDKGEYNYRNARKGFTGTFIDIQFNIQERGFDSLAEEIRMPEFFS